MSIETKPENVQHLLEMQNNLNPTAESFPEWQTLQEIKPDFEKKMARFEQEQQLLSIGIMGQVKAGKSTFLNALLFDGQPILPEAATPKTANLTRITYGESPRLVVEYYTSDEWRVIEKLADTGAEHGQAKVAKELVKMTRDNGLDVAAILAKGSEQEIHANGMDDLLTRLNQFVGDNGEHTALVKMTHLYLPKEELRGYEVVDTPGMNDPVQSRTQKTRDYMGQCDVVFFLSRASQFLDQSDMNLLAEQLPSKGIKRMVLVAGQFDSAILDDGYDRASLSETEKNLKKRLGAGASKKIQELAEHREKAGNPAIAEMLKSMKEPVFASTFAHGFACWPEASWGKTMRHVYNELLELADQEWGGYEFTKDDWLRIGNFESLVASYERAREDRVAILEAQKQGCIPETLGQLYEHSHRLLEAVKARHVQLKKGDLQELRAQQKACEKRIASMNGVVAGHIDQALDKAKTAEKGLLRNLRESSAQHAKLSTRTGTETKTRSEEVSTSVWYKPWTWWDTEIRYSTYTVSYEYLNASDAAEQVRTYASMAAMDIEHGFNRLVNADQLKADLRKVLVNELDTASDDFDPEQFRSVLTHTLDSLEMPELHLDIGDMTGMISQQFSGEVSGSDEMERLRSALGLALQDVFKQLSERFEVSAGLLFEQLREIRDGLCDQLTLNVKNELAHIEDDFTRQRERLASYEQLMDDIHAILEEAKECRTA